MIQSGLLLLEELEVGVVDVVYTIDLLSQFAFLDHPVLTSKHYVWDLAVSSVTKSVPLSCPRELTP